MSIVQKAVQTVVKLVPDKAPDPLIGAKGAIGAPLARIDGPLKVAGAARFTAEVPVENLVHAALVGSTIARGRIARIDTAEAEAAPGVVLVMTHRNAPKMKAPAQMFSDRSSAATSNLKVMQDASIHWNGEPVALVAAETREQAEAAAALIRVSYEEAPTALSFNDLRGEAKPPKNILGEPSELKIGDAGKALETAAIVVDEVYRTPRHNHAAIELHATTAIWQGRDRLILHDACQALGGTRTTLAKVFSLKPEQVRVFAPFVGGAFGNKTVWNHQILCAAAAKLLGRPVRIVLSREDVFRITGGRTLSEQRVALGARPDGSLAALIHTGATAVTTHNAFPEQFTFPARHLYAAETFHLAQEVVTLDMVANTSMRAPGESIGTFALESALDELARTMGIDPIDLRHRIEPEKDPTTGSAFSSRHLLEAYRQGAERFGWSERSPTPRARRDGDWLVGMGVATATYPYYRMPGGTARIRLDADGSAVVQAAAHEMGMGTATVQIQHAAERLGLTVDQVAFEYGDTELPPSVIAGGSTQTASIIAAVTAAAEALVKELLKLAGNDSPLAGARANEVRPRDGGLYLIAQPDKGESYRSILSRAARDRVEAEAAAPAPTEMMKYSMHSTGAQFCEVRVNDVTGEVRVARCLGSFDVGRVVNARTAASQLRGGIVMGIGLALTEETQFDERTGRIVTRSLAEYHVPVHLDVPRIEVMWTDIPDPHSPLGVRGIGEIGITGVGAAVANAVYNATGKRIRDLPITLDKLLAD